MAHRERTKLNGTPAEVYTRSAGVTALIVENTGVVPVFIDHRADVAVTGPSAGVEIRPGERLTLPKATETRYPQPKLYGVTTGELGELSAVTFG